MQKCLKFAKKFLLFIYIFLFFFSFRCGKQDWLTEADVVLETLSPSNGTHFSSNGVWSPRGRSVRDGQHFHRFLVIPPPPPRNIFYLNFFCAFLRISYGGFLRIGPFLWPELESAEFRRFNLYSPGSIMKWSNSVRKLLLILDYTLNNNIKKKVNTYNE